MDFIGQPSVCMAELDSSLPAIEVFVDSGEPFSPY